jgi:tetratricopeptide (TPR) repeat protein
MTLTYSHGREFVQQVLPFLQKHDPHGLVRYLQQHWPHHQLCELLVCGHDDAVKVAAACFTLTGTMDDNAVLAPILHEEDPGVVAMIEHAMWSIWFRAGDNDGNRRLQRAVRLIGENEYDAAIRCLDRLIARQPRFAEAYNQRAIAYFLKEAYAASLADCTRTLRINPFHFGAMAGVGHCQASLGRLDRALEAYDRALQMHPHMDGIRQSVQHIRSKMGVAPTPVYASRAVRR